jgi:DnaJ-class molecular chaperone
MNKCPACNGTHIQDINGVQRPCQICTGSGYIK